MKTFEVRYSNIRYRYNFRHICASSEKDACALLLKLESEAYNIYIQETIAL